MKYVLGGDLHFACTFLKIEDKSSLQKLFYRRSLVISLVESNGIVWLMQIDELSVSYLVRHLLKLPSTDSSSDGCGSASSVHTPQPTAPYIYLSISHCVLPARSRAVIDTTRRRVCGCIDACPLQHQQLSRLLSDVLTTGLMETDF